MIALNQTKLKVSHKKNGTVSWIAAEVSLGINLFYVYRAELIGKAEPEKKASLWAATAEDI